MQRRTIDEYISEMMQMRERSSLLRQQKTKDEFPPIIDLGHETPSDVENDTEKDDFSGRKQSEKPNQQHSVQEVFAPQSEIPAEPPSELITISESEAARQKFDSEEETERRIEQDERAADRTELKEKTNSGGSGKLIVNVTTGAGLFPVEGATVIISDMADEGGSEIASVTTDISGKTPPIYLPAPREQNSLSPDEKGETRSRYTVTVMAPGYVTTIVEGVSLFDGITSVQKVDMLTESASNGSSAPRIIEEDTVYRL